MKRIIILSSILAFASLAQAANERTDTLAMAQTADSVVIRQNAKEMSISIFGINGDKTSVTTISRVVDSTCASDSAACGRAGRNSKILQRTASKCSVDKGKEKWAFIIGGLGIGANATLGGPAALDTRMFKSLNVTWLYALGFRVKFPTVSGSLSFGLGLDWRTYRSYYPSACFTLSDKGNVVLGEYPEGVIPSHSQLRTFSLMLPVLWRQTLPFNFPRCDRMSVVAGPILDFNVHGSLKNEWLNGEGNKVKQTSNSIHQRPVTFDLFGALYLNSWLGVYVRYSPMTVLKPGSVKFTPLTTGIICNF